MNIYIILLISIIITLFLLIALNVVYVVQQQTICVIERFGKYVGHTYPGLNFKLPFPISIIVARISLKITQSEHELGIKTKDNAFIKLPVKVQLRVLPEKVSDAFYKLENSVEQINSFILNIIRSKSATLDLEDIYTKKSELAEYVSETLKQKVSDYGYEIVDVLVDEPEPSAEVQEAYNNVIASKRELEAAHNHAAAKKALLIGEAEAEAKSLELKAESYAKQRKVITKGLKEALDAIKQKDLRPRYILEFISSIDYRDTIRDAAKSDSNTLIFSNDPSNDLKKLSPLLATKQVKNNSSQEDIEEQEYESEESDSAEEVWE